MWRQDSAIALAFVDEPQVLRLVRPNIQATALDHGRFDRFITLRHWLPGWSQTSTISTTTDTSAYGTRPVAAFYKQRNGYDTTAVND